MRLLPLVLLTLFSVNLAQPALAQGSVPEVPDALQVLADRGAQVRYLGKKHGMEGWISVFQGQEQYHYVTPDGQGFVMGLLFDKDGKMVTIKQVQELQAQNDGVLDALAVDPQEESLAAVKTETNEAFQYKSPAEKMFDDVENSNYIAFGSKDAPVIYSFMDPQCPHCHNFMQDLRNGYLDKGLVQIRMIPVGFSEERMAQAAFLLAAPDAQTQWYSHLDEKKPLPAKQDVNTAGVQKNMMLMQNWKFDVTPMTVYRGKDGKVKIIRGRADNMADIIADLPAS